MHSAESAAVTGPGNRSCPTGSRTAASVVAPPQDGRQVSAMAARHRVLTTHAVESHLHDAPADRPALAV
jgi:hypothetical protein